MHLTMDAFAYRVLSLLLPCLYPSSCTQKYIVPRIPLILLSTDKRLPLDRLTIAPKKVLCSP